MSNIQWIGLGAVIFLLGTHFGVHLYFKRLKRLQNERKAKRLAEEAKPVKE